MRKLSNKDKAIRWGVKQPSVVKRFDSRLIHKEDGCIDFNGAKWDSRDRYRAFRIHQVVKKQVKISETVKAHRFSFAVHYGFDALPKATGNAPDAKVINHICGNVRCVNPEHMNVITVSENAKYRGPKSVKKM